MGDGHPESPQRLEAITDRLIASGLDVALEFCEAPAASDESMARAHDSLYLAELRDILEQVESSGQPHALDPDTVAAPGTRAAVLHAAGAAVAATDAVIDGRFENAFCAVRPPGHHATRRQTMGFCFVNNIAVAARHALDARGLERVAVVDFDVHHGNGTQNSFWDDAELFYGSCHQSPFYPGTGEQRESGVARNIVNIPLARGCNSATLRQRWAAEMMPALQSFAPELLIISAGFDAHHKDPLGGLGFTDADFHWLTEALLQCAGVSAGGRVVSILENNTWTAAELVADLARAVAVR
jgi:acetoin utilization deacetylase AcuC-like enzyme